MNRFSVMAIFFFFFIMAAQVKAADTVQKPLQQNPAVELFKSDLSAKRLQMMQEGMGLPEKEGEKFWPLYREFQQKRQQANKDVVKIMIEYSSNPLSFTNEKTLLTFKKIFAKNRLIEALEEEYFDKISEVTSPTVAARFLQIEDMINTIIELQVLSQLPLFPKILDADKNTSKN